MQFKGQFAFGTMVNKSIFGKDHLKQFVEEGRIKVGMGDVPLEGDGW
jgi:hypothetical protein